MAVSVSAVYADCCCCRSCCCLAAARCCRKACQSFSSDGSSAAMVGGGGGWTVALDRGATLDAIALNTVAAGVGDGRAASDVSSAVMSMGGCVPGAALAFAASAARIMASAVMDDDTLAGV